LENSPQEFIALKKAMELNGHTHIHILKLDGEGKEYEVIEELIRQFRNHNLPFSQLLVEIPANVTDGQSFAKLYRFFEKMENAGLRPFRNELNISPMVPEKDKKNALCEYSFLNLSMFCANSETPN